MLRHAGASPDSEHGKKALRRLKLPGPFSEASSCQGPGHWQAEAAEQALPWAVRFSVNLGLGLVFYGLLVKCCAMSLFERSWISSDGARRQHKLPCDSHGRRL